MVLDSTANFGKVTVSTGYDASATSIALDTGEGSKLPNPPTDQPFNIVWYNSTDFTDPSEDSNVEIVRVTSRSTDTLTVTRAQEGTSATTKNTVGKTYSMVLAPTSKMITDIDTNKVEKASSSSTDNLMSFADTSGGAAKDSGIATGDVVTPSSTDTFTNKTFDANGTGNSLSNVETDDIASGSKSGSDATLITGTAGTSGDLAQWNVDGDLVDGATPPSGAIVGTSDTQTLTNKRIDTRTNTITSSATPTPAGDTTDIFTVTALAANATFGAPTGTPVNGQKLIIRIKDDGTSRTLAYNAIYRALGITLPTATTISKTIYIGFIYNSTDSKWDAVAVAEES